MTQREDQALSELTDRLRGRFPDVPAATVDEVVAKLHHEFDGRPVRDFVPVLVERMALARMRALSNRQPVAASA